MSHSSKSTIFLNFFLFHSIKSGRSSSVIGSNAIFFTTFCDLSPSQNDPILFYLFLFFFLYELIYVAQYWTLNTWLSFYWCQTVRRRKRLDVLVNNHSIFFFWIGFSNIDMCCIFLELCCLVYLERLPLNVLQHQQIFSLKREETMN